MWHHTRPDYGKILIIFVIILIWFIILNWNFADQRRCKLWNCKSFELFSFLINDVQNAWNLSQIFARLIKRIEQIFWSSYFYYHFLAIKKSPSENHASILFCYFRIHSSKGPYTNHVDSWGGRGLAKWPFYNIILI